MAFELSDARIMPGEFGNTYLSIMVDGVEAQIGWEQRHRRRYGMVFLGRSMLEIVPVKIIPADPDYGSEELEVRGYTDDERIIELYDYMMSDDDLGVDTAVSLAIPGG
jgi:hypothetical protein